MKPVLMIAVATALIGAAAPAGAAQCGCYHYHHVHHVNHRMATRVVYRTRVVVEPQRTVVEAAAPAPPPYYGPRFAPRPFYGPRPYPLYGYGYGPHWRRFGPYGVRRPYGWRPY